MATTTCIKATLRKWCLSVVTLISIRSIQARFEFRDSVPWISNTDYSSRYKTEPYLEIPPSVFAPNGRLYSLEAVLQACEDVADQSSNTVIAIRCADGVVVVSTSHRSPYLVDSLGINSKRFEVKGGCMSLIGHDNIHKYSKKVMQSLPYVALGRASDSSIFGAVAGNAADSQILKRKCLRSSGLSYGYQDESLFEVATLARKVADQNQLLTQSSGKGRMLASTLLLVSTDEIWRVEPTGQFCTCSAAVIGRNCRITEQLLWDKMYLQENERMDSTPFFSPGTPTSVPKQGERTTKRVAGDLVHHLLSELTIEQAIALATVCLWHSIASCDENILGTDDSCFVLHGLSLRKNRLHDEVQFYNNESLKRHL